MDTPFDHAWAILKSIPRGPNEMRALAPIQAARDFVHQHGDSTGPMKAHADRVARELQAHLFEGGPAPQLPTMERQAGRQEYGGNIGAPEGMTPSYAEAHIHDTYG
tara:strand:- start:515 stop:832 length:318 start_codon:yes stop_codon:yes gene_type:complete